MRALSAPELLGVWERGLAERPVERALTLWEAASPGASRDALAALSIGRRDACLLTLREWTFGPRMVSVAVCPNCSVQLEFTFNVDDVRAGDGAECPAEAAVMVAGYEVHFRLPSSADVAASVRRGEERRSLFERCLLKAHSTQGVTTPDRLPAEVVDAVAERMAQVDPQADVQLDIACPSCRHRWRQSFDIVSYFWSEIDAWARRLLREVHVLASAYGWTEHDILALSPTRRRFYLEMTGA